MPRRAHVRSSKRNTGGGLSYASARLSERSGPLPVAASVDGGDMRPVAGDASADPLVPVSTSAPSSSPTPSSCAETAGAWVSPMSPRAPAASPSSLAGVVVVAVSVSGGPDVDEPFGAPAPLSSPGVPAAAFSSLTRTVTDGASPWAGSLVLAKRNLADVLESRPTLENEKRRLAEIHEAGHFL
jgi:hypothetical protein